MLDRLFEIVFKYRPVVFGQGDLALASAEPAVPVTLAAIAAAVAVWAYVRAKDQASRGARGFLLGLRLAALAVLLLVLLRPVLVVRAVEPQRNVLAVLVDDSRSLSIPDPSGRPRGAFVTDALARSAPLRTALEQKFQLRFFTVSGATTRVTDPGTATFTGSRSLLGAGLRRAAEELAGLPASGIVLVTDGADTSTEPPTEAVRALRTAGLPVFAIGLGEERLPRDIQVGRVDPPREVLKGATLVLDIMLSQTGYNGRTVPVVVEDEGRAIATQDVALPSDGSPATVRVHFALPDAGPRVLTFRVPLQDGEQVTGNNSRQSLVTVRDRRERILYVEGEPRPEMKFLRQAVADDPQLQVVTLQRTALRKFLRLDIDSPEELAGGFPQTRDELYGYRGLVLGSIEAAAFTPDQLRMMADFVSVRGGGLLALGGRLAFGEGGYAGTPVAEALPVDVDPPGAGPITARPITVRATRLGQTHAATQIADSEEASSKRWSALPALTAVNVIRRIKPGAALLLESGTGAETQAVLAFHRYGAGKALALTPQDVWLWQMHGDIALEDATHETLWRRLLRWLTDGVPDRVAVALDHDRIQAGDPVTVTATVRDPRFLGLNDAAVTARVLGPDGHVSSIPLALVMDRDGEYRGRFVPPVDGLYEVRIDAASPGSPPAEARTYLRAAPDDGESFDATLRAPLLQRIADDTGGRFYTPANAASLPEDITYLGRGVTVIQQKDLWDMPAVLVLLLLLLGSEWVLRRRWGLP